MSKILVFGIRIYQKHISYIFANSCIYNPSCSQYSIDAIQKYGALHGVSLTFRRVIRCRPPFNGGQDPVP
jgi:hypothetical protein